jgi:hypothetical protein
MGKIVPFVAPDPEFIDRPCDKEFCKNTVRVVAQRDQEHKVYCSYQCGAYAQKAHTSEVMGGTRGQGQ